MSHDPIGGQMSHDLKSIAEGIVRDAPGLLAMIDRHLAERPWYEKLLNVVHPYYWIALLLVTVAAASELIK